MEVRDRAQEPAEIEVLDLSDRSPAAVSQGVSLALAEGDLPPDRHPALVYLASPSPGSRRTMRAALERIADLVSGGRAGAADLA